ncbi:hypothetical protein B0A48_09105 [Cryoendolithus antarcticus]|uniref:Uncharacterized protein n=1 Tax=Cryoendolithus antarcticus TaxID=1507870 RepID=A0A1V8T1Q9_9PEZI|nr:hypothetical protein B0A48_09105 [Cryoendolithus antarcticus]
MSKFFHQIDMNSTASSISVAKSSRTRYLCQNLRVNLLLELQLLLLTFSIGIQDAIAMPILHCITSMQTGNTMTLALAASGFTVDGTCLANVGISQAAFALGAYLTGRIGNVIGPKRRDYLLLSHFM